MVLFFSMECSRYFFNENRVNNKEWNKNNYYF